MSGVLLTLEIKFEHDVMSARQRCRALAQLLGFDNQEQVRLATAVSEIARNVFQYASSGKVEFLVEGASAPQLFVVKISDKGGGIPNLQQILDGRYKSETGMGLGIIGARRLVDQFQIDSRVGLGTTVQLK